ncbi:hypothetical protein, partial [Escherichia coli]|uniref:hypothetical protein n=1 Tax=Escherichia coli TaxID=562 RepID=UPI001BC87142
TPAEEAFERALRPKHLDEYVGQQKNSRSTRYFLLPRHVQPRKSTMIEPDRLISPTKTNAR